MKYLLLLFICMNSNADIKYCHTTQRFYTSPLEDGSHLNQLEYHLLARRMMCYHDHLQRNHIPTLQRTAIIDRYLDGIATVESIRLKEDLHKLR